MSKIVGIDLGTTNSLVATVDSGIPLVIADAEGRRLTPSVVHIPGPDAEPIVGHQANRIRALKPAQTVYSVKRFMGRRGSDIAREEMLVTYPVRGEGAGPVTIDLPGRAWTPEEISAEVLKKLKRDAEASLNEPVTRAVITVPAYFNDAQRNATKRAGELAGFTVERIVNEPTAAALAYGLDKLKEHSRVAVYDLGGGTFDLSILELNAGVFQVLSTNGDTRLGGDDLDKRIVDFLVDKIKSAGGPDATHDAPMLARIRETAEQAKIALSTETETEIILPFLTGQISTPPTNAQAGSLPPRSDTLSPQREAGSLPPRSDTLSPQREAGSLPPRSDTLSPQREAGSLPPRSDTLSPQRGEGRGEGWADQSRDNAFSFSLRFTRAELESLTRDLIARTRPHCLRALADAKLSAADLDQVILVGGQTRMPLVRRTVAEIFGCAEFEETRGALRLGDVYHRPKGPQLNTSQNPDEAVALGAAIQAEILSGGFQNVLLLDVTPLSLGIETFGGLMNVIIHRNSTIPVKAGEMFTTAVDNQKNMLIHVLQGERERAQDNWSLGRFTIDFEPAPKGVPRIGVQFEIDANGILHVLARDTKTGRQTVVDIKSAVDVDDAAVQRMVEESVEHAFEDLASRRWIEATLRARETLAATRKGLADCAGELDDAYRAQVETALHAVETALATENPLSKTGDTRALQTATTALDEATTPLANLLMDKAMDAMLRKRGLIQ